jgi:hypothetical protein
MCRTFGCYAYGSDTKYSFVLTCGDTFQLGQKKEHAQVGLIPFSKVTKNGVVLLEMLLRTCSLCHLNDKRLLLLLGVLGGICNSKASYISPFLLLLAGKGIEDLFLEQKGERRAKEFKECENGNMRLK